VHTMRAFIHLLSLHSNWAAVGVFVIVFIFLGLLWPAAVKRSASRSVPKSDGRPNQREGTIWRSTSSNERQQEPWPPLPSPPASAPREAAPVDGAVSQAPEGMRPHMPSSPQESVLPPVSAPPPEVNPTFGGKASAPRAGSKPTSAPPPAVREELIDVQASASQSLRERASVSGREHDATIVNVFYATDRQRSSAADEKLSYGAQQSLLGQLEYGECEISIPDVHVTGGMESPSWLRFEFRPDPDKHIVLRGTTSAEEEDFYEKVRTSVAKSLLKDAFIFIHGYNVSFEDAARRTGQFAYDLKFMGAPIFYSWPSNGKFANYMKDENNVIWTTPHLETFLYSLSQRSGADRIHIIAHSMGNRAVCEAIRSLSHDPALQLKLTHLVLAAPDIDAATFAELAATLRKHSARVTLYESSNDKALMASKKLHGNPRAGEPLLVIEGMDTINASAVDTDFLGHSYWCDEWVVMSDIHSILALDQPATTRFGLEVRANETGPYYEFRR
jgi:esterase/lipase superfamily enzyme